ncbi:ABC transporter permease [Natranaerobius thermophilus]|uniref:Inner-membrane translocator n=1 Tax=Natranaerobius thermophilus (strain ATCC BAA-1301 / DSM 18059 / JW/NM-WN-LF) TaxID=457570 RepID=B2A5S5_NATTJ|nr:ABC transporter permease [Natranaerobius thermophilus]ACB84018.1 inner-membrane translocator [Natranaerobius thermophilus JW/NM-WN-LF]
MTQPKNKINESVNNAMEKVRGAVMSSQNVRSTASELIMSLASILVALLVGVIFILIAEQSPIDAYYALFDGAFGSFTNFMGTLHRSTPLILTGLAVAFSFRTGLFNIGAEGQLLMGGFIAGLVGFYFEGLPTIIHLPLTVLAGMLAGGIWAGIPGILKAKLGVHEVINTIMLNHIAIHITIYYGINRFREGGRQATPYVQETAELFQFNQMPEHPILQHLPFVNFFDHTSINLHSGFLIALIVAVIVWYILWKTTLGYEIRAVGLNSPAAEYGGINVSQKIVVAMLISGGIAGLAGISETLGTHQSFVEGMDAGHGFTGIAVALLGRNHPVGVILGGLLFGALSQGGLQMQFAGVPREIVIIIQALVIFFVASFQMFKIFIARRKAKGEAK